MNIIQPGGYNPDTTIVLDAHLLKTYSSCQRKFWWLEDQHIVPKEMGAAPSFGIVFHEGVAAYRNAKKAGASPEEAYNAGCQALLTHYKKRMPPEYLTDVKQADARSPRNALRIFTGYCQHYEPMGLTFHHVEVPFAIVLGQATVLGVQKDVIYTGIIDSILEMHTRIYVNDLKTSAWSINQEKLDSYKMDQGLIGYMIAAKQLLGITTSYAVVHCIWVGKETKGPKAKPLDEYFHTKELYWDQDQQDEWVVNTLLKAQEIDTKRQQNGPWLMAWNESCNTFKGCEYRPLCSSTPNSRKQVISMDYAPGYWRPLEDERMQRE